MHQPFPSFRASRLVILLAISALTIRMASAGSPPIDHTPEKAACPFDTLPPVITNCPSDTVIPFDNNICGAILTWPAIVATDNCDTNPVVTSTYASGDTFRLNTTVVQVTAQDSTGNISTCQFQVELSNSGFGMLCPQDVNVVANDTCSAVATWDSPVIIDLCNSNHSLDSTLEKNSVITDTTVVTYTLTNDLGNLFVCQFSINLQDLTPPIILNCPSDTTLLPTASCDAVFVWDESAITVKDNCDGAVLIPDPVYQSGDTFPPGVTTISYSAVDAAGNMTSNGCSFKVTVKDAQPPAVISCPGAQVVTVWSTCDTIVTWPDPVFADGCDTSLSITSNFSSGDSFSIGMHTVQVTATDDQANTAHCQFDITVKDVMPPVLGPCPSDTTIFTPTGSCEASLLYSMPTAQDNCAGPLQPVASPATQVFLPGTTTVTITATDPGGNQTSCAFNVVVKDTIGPVTNCPQDIEVQVDGTIVTDPDQIVASVSTLSCDQVAISFQLPGITDNCSVMLQDSSMLSGTFDTGTHLVTYNFSDPYGNTGACTYEVTVSGGNNNVTIQASQNPACPGSDVTLSTSISDPTAFFHWAGPNFNSSDAQPVISNFGFINVGDYAVTVTLNGCTFTSQMPLHLEAAKPVTAQDDSYQTPINTPAHIEVLSNDDLNDQDVAVSITIPPAFGQAVVDSNKITYTPQQTYVGIDFLTYQICVTGCPDLCDEAQVSLDINLQSSDTCIIPNLLTPNDDGLNDILLLDCLSDGGTNSKLLIYNQWGSLVFKAEPYQNDWQGHAMGKPDQPLPDGTYFYIFWRNKDHDPPQKGFITLWR